MPADFFKSRKSAAVFKHGILKASVVFASKTGKDVDGNRVVFLDGYAGCGEYDDGQPGSPLLLSRCAEFVKDYRDVLGFFVEQDRANFDNLERVLKRRAEIPSGSCGVVRSMSISRVARNRARRIPVCLP